MPYASRRSNPTVLTATKFKHASDRHLPGSSRCSRRPQRNLDPAGFTQRTANDTESASCQIGCSSYLALASCTHTFNYGFRPIAASRTDVFRSRNARTRAVLAPFTYWWMPDQRFSPKSTAPRRIHSAIRKERFPVQQDQPLFAVDLAGTGGHETSANELHERLNHRGPSESLVITGYSGKRIGGFRGDTVWPIRCEAWISEGWQNRSSNDFR